jgi:hypothetical protein
MPAEPGQGRARRLKLLALLAILAAAVVIVIALPDEQSRRGRASGRPTTTLSPTTTRSSADRVEATTATTIGTTTSTAAPTTARPAAKAPATPTTTVGPGALPQTGAFPPSAGAQFNGEMLALWRGVVTGAVPPARPAFFPESAYLQLKATADPAADYVNRLLGEFREDLAAAHALLGPEAGEARLVSVGVPQQYGHWVVPGTCDNRVGYFEVPNSRLVYRDGAGQIRSFGIASMISWRGTWYVVHLGGVVRPSGGGMVDDPEVGPGAPAYSATC